mmetsp:Transcript_9788/g.23501  ORF Transcript_9788/g.23501 Transcript_9788/m.23501 type:complete len:261 (-) Transcript_9788:319-1101(-)
MLHAVPHLLEVLGFCRIPQLILDFPQAVRHLLLKRSCASSRVRIRAPGRARPRLLGALPGACQCCSIVGKVRAVDRRKKPQLQFQTVLLHLLSVLHRSVEKAGRQSQNSRTPAFRSMLHEVCHDCGHRMVSLGTMALIEDQQRQLRDQEKALVHGAPKDLWGTNQHLVLSQTGRPVQLAPFIHLHTTEFVHRRFLVAMIPAVLCLLVHQGLRRDDEKHVLLACVWTAQDMIDNLGSDQCLAIVGGQRDDDILANSSLHTC